MLGCRYRGNGEPTGARGGVLCEDCDEELAATNDLIRG